MKGNKFIGDFLKRIKRPICLTPDKEYKLVTIKMNHNGVVLRGLKKGSEIKSKMFEVKEGDFILSGIDARNGAFGIVPKELDGAIVTNDFWYFDIDEDIINKNLFLELTSTSWFDEICNRGSDGTTQRIRLQKDKFFNQKINLPLPKEQARLIEKLHSIKSKQARLLSYNNEQIENVSFLKSSILEEAVCGKLTEDWRKNNPDIAPATELLKQIKLSKQKLVDDKKLKKEKPLQPLKNIEKPFKLPNSWAWSRLGEAGVFERGKSKHRPRKDPSLFDNGIYPFVQTGDVAQSKKNGFIINTYNKKYNEKGLAQSRIWEKDTLCITIAANIAETGYLGMQACFPDSVVGFTSLIDKSISKYIKYYIELTRDDIEKYAPATAQKNINLGIINSLSVPIPPLMELKIIVQKVEELMRFCASLESEILQNKLYTQKLLQSVIKETF